MPERILLTPEQRRAKRQERRDRQRVANVGRAAKMHAVRVAFEKTNSAADGANSAAAKTARPLPEFNVGCSGWFYWHWRDNFYPSGLASNKWFDHYAGQFKTVELNAPFYSWPTVATVNTWIRQAGRRRFVYTIKACELITHVKRFTGTARLVKDFGLIADLLGPRMGCFLFQLPPSFHFSAARLKAIVSQLDPKRRNVVEFRHASWWNEKVYEAFRQAGIIFCSCSGPRLPDELIQTTDEIYLRFHGTSRWYRHDYTDAELAVWVKRIRESSARRVWAYFNNDRDCHAVRNARQLLMQLKRTDA